jgi:hypothetical protein
MSIDNLSRAHRIRGGLYGLLVGDARCPLWISRLARASARFGKTASLMFH